MKDWRDLFYFSKSERRALTLLSFLILGAWLLLWVTEPEEEAVPLTVVAPKFQTDSVPKLKSQDTVRSISRTVSKPRSSYSENDDFRSLLHPRPNAPEVRSFRSEHR